MKQPSFKNKTSEISILKSSREPRLTPFGELILEPRTRLLPFCSLQRNTPVTYCNRGANSVQFAGSLPDVNDSVLTVFHFEFSVDRIVVGLSGFAR